MFTDVVSQRELRALCALRDAFDTQCEALQRRVLAGATVESGALSLKTTSEEFPENENATGFSHLGVTVSISPARADAA